MPAYALSKMPAYALSKEIRHRPLSLTPRVPLVLHFSYRSLNRCNGRYVCSAFGAIVRIAVFNARSWRFDGSRCDIYVTPFKTDERRCGDQLNGFHCLQVIVMNVS
jgi:hypothetical protein